ncbi:MAG TPA: hypothetical protein VJT75_04110 [Thermoleophilaceae bacterium]|nr:hypothetical protein [Thermoleophilaceae bacterium]
MSRPQNPPARAAHANGSGGAGSLPPRVPPASARPAQGAKSDFGAVWLWLAGFAARHGPRGDSERAMLRSGMRIGRFYGLAAAFGAPADRRALLATFECIVTVRVSRQERPLIKQASKAARVVNDARISSTVALARIAALEPKRDQLVTELGQRQDVVDQLTALQPLPPAPSPPTEEDMRAEQADGEPAEAPTWRSRLPLRLVEMALELITFYPLLAGAAIGSALLGVTGTRVLVLLMALAASLAIPLAASKLGALSVEGALRDHRRALLAWFGLAVLMCMLLVVGTARAIQAMDRAYGTFAGGLGLFGVTLIMVGLVVLEFLLGRKAQDARNFQGRLHVAERQRERQSPQEQPESRELTVARERCERTRGELAGVESDLDAAQSDLVRAVRDHAAGNVALSGIADEADRVVDREFALGRMAAAEALRMFAAYLVRYSGDGAEPPDDSLIDEMKRPEPFDPFAFVADGPR